MPLLHQLLNRRQQKVTVQNSITPEMELQLTLFSSKNFSLIDTSLRILSYFSLCIWNSCCDCSIFGRVFASRGPRFSSSRSVRQASYSILGKLRVGGKKKLKVSPQPFNCCTFPPQPKMKYWEKYSSARIKMLDQVLCLSSSLR